MERGKGSEEVPHAGRKIPKILLIGEFLLAVILFRYLLNFTSMVSPIEGSWIKVAVNILSILLSLMLTILTVNSILGIPSARPQSWRVVIRASIILFITNFLYGCMEDLGLISTGIVFRIEYVGIIVLLVDIIMFLPSVRKYSWMLSRMGIVMDKFKTAEFGKSLKKVYRGEFSIRDSLEIAEKEISAVFSAPP